MTFTPTLLKILSITSQITDKSVAIFQLAVLGLETSFINLMPNTHSIFVPLKAANEISSYLIKYNIKSKTHNTSHTERR